MAPLIRDDRPAPDGPPHASILIPTWNGEEDLEELLPALAAQEADFGFELRVIDSSSSDRTVELLEDFGAHVEVIPQAEFRHGATRNRIAEGARGELLVFLSQDVLPADEHFLTELLRPFEDPTLAGVTARVLPRPGDDPLAARTVLDLPEVGDTWETWDAGETGALWDLEPAERARRLRFNNVSSAVRASVFREIPFPDLDFGEDFGWAARALNVGHRLAHAPKAVSYHAHTYDLRGAFERYRVDAAFHKDAHGWRVRPSLFSVLRGIAYEVREDARYLARQRGPRRLRSLLKSPGLRTAQCLGQYVGGRG
jgi:rhamnosyltransferase